MPTARTLTSIILGAALCGVLVTRVAGAEEEGAMEKAKEATQGTYNATKDAGEKAWDATKEGAHDALDASRKAGDEAWQGARDGAHELNKKIEGDE